ISSKAQNHSGAPKVMRLIDWLKRVAAMKVRGVSLGSAWREALSRQFFPNRLGQQNLRQQQAAAAHQTEWKQIAILLVFFYAHGRFLQLVDVVENLFQRPRIRGAEKFAVRDFGNFSQAGFVKLYALVLVENVAQRVSERAASGVNRRRRNSVDPGPDGVEMDFQGLHRFGRGLGRDFSGVVFSVSEQHQDAAFGMLVVEATGGGGHGRADGRPVFHQADAQAIEILQQPVVIERHGAYHVGASCKGDDADAIIGAGFDKFASDFADG